MPKSRAWYFVVLIALIVVVVGLGSWAQDELRLPSVLILDTSDRNGALYLDGGATLTVRQGDLIVNSSHSSALFNANSQIEVQAGTILIAGGYNNLGEGTITPPPTTGAKAVADPLTKVQCPEVADVRSRQKLFVPDKRETTLKPGFYVGGINAFGKDAILRLDPGVYVVSDGDFFVGVGEFSGDGVTIIMSGRKPGRLTFANKARGKLVAPKEGPLKDILLVTAGAAEGNNSDIGFNDARVLLQGTVYAPRGRIGVFANSRVVVGHVVGFSLIMTTGAVMEVTGLGTTDPGWNGVEIPLEPER